MDSMIVLFGIVALFVAANAAALKKDSEPEFQKNQTFCVKDGDQHAFGDEWSTRHMRYRCGPFGLYTIVGCITDDGRVLQRSERYLSNGMVHECVGDADGTVRYAWTMCGVPGMPDCETSPLISAGKVRSFAAEYPPFVNLSMSAMPTCNDSVVNATEPLVSDNFRYKCVDADRFEIIGCVTDDGHAMEIGEQYSNKNIAHECVGDGDGSVRYNRVMCGNAETGDCLTNSRPVKNAGRANARSLAFALGNPPFSISKSGKLPCDKNNKQHKSGEEWTEGNFRYSCGQFGLYQILGCITQSGHKMNRGDHFVEANLRHECSGAPQFQGQIYYSWQPCGVAGSDACDIV